MAVECSVPGEERFRSLALVNTRVNRPSGAEDALASAEGAGAWLAAHDLVPPGLPVEEGRVAALRSFRESVRAVLTARTTETIRRPPTWRRSTAP